MDGFDKVTIGLIQEKITKLIYNPAYIIDKTSDIELFFDFRSTIEHDMHHYDYVHNWYDYRVAFIPYPMYYSKPRIEPDPVVSLGLFSKPLPNTLNNFYFGLTYQLIYLNEEYYAIPQDIYYPIFGYDFLGIKSTSLNDYPVVDRYTGTDYMKNRGHLISSYFGYDYSEDIKIGFKINRTVYDREGSGGSSNLWENYSNYSSKWYKIEERIQNYGHWDFGAGIDYKLDEKSNIGLSIGYMPGKVTQNLDRLDSSYYTNGTINTGTYWNISRRYSPTVQDWEKKGNVFYAGINYKTDLNKDQTILVRYNYQSGDKDITNSSNIFDTSYYFYRSQWDTIIYRSESFSKVADNRFGSGTDKSGVHEIQALMLWTLNEKFTINFGIYYSYENMKVRTTESVVSDRISSYNNTGSYPSSHFYSTKESKDLKWEFDWNISSLQIPVFFNWKINDYFKLLMGLNRIISDIESKEITTAYFHSKIENRNGEITSKERYAERYKMPKESISEIRTASFFGLNFTPTEKVLLRLLVQPNFHDDARDSQVWLSFQLTP